MAGSSIAKRFEDHICSEDGKPIVDFSVLSEGANNVIEKVAAVGDCQADNSCIVCGEPSFSDTCALTGLKAAIEKYYPDSGEDGFFAGLLEVQEASKSDSEI